MELICDARGWSYDEWRGLSEAAKDRALAWMTRQTRRREAWRDQLLAKELYTADVATMLVMEE